VYCGNVQQQKLQFQILTVFSAFVDCDSVTADRNGECLWESESGVWRVGSVAPVLEMWLVGDAQVHLDGDSNGLGDKSSNS
jgi:hypothetical protein